MAQALLAVNRESEKSYYITKQCWTDNLSMLALLCFVRPKHQSFANQHDMGRTLEPWEKCTDGTLALQ